MEAGAGIDRGQGFRPIGPDASAIFATAWQIQALAAAKLTGLKIPNLKEVLKRSDAFIQSKQWNDGGFGMPRSTPDTDSITLTGAGMNSAQLVRANSTALNTAGALTIVINKAAGFTTDMVLNASFQWNTADVHGWLFYTQALITKGGMTGGRGTKKASPGRCGTKKAFLSCSPTRNPMAVGCARPPSLSAPKPTPPRSAPLRRRATTEWDNSVVRTGSSNAHSAIRLATYQTLHCFLINVSSPPSRVPSLPPRYSLGPLAIAPSAIPAPAHGR